MTAERSVIPPDFAWGISVSSYQTEDVALDHNDPNFFQTDWDLFFAAGRLRVPKGNGTYSFTEMERDIAALRNLGVTHYRFSLEWARIEPEPGRFNEAAISHYRHLAERLRENGITPIVALWHFTFPAWLADLRNGERHGWMHERLRTHWPRYVKKVVSRLAETVDIFAPQNEPNTQSTCGYLAGIWPPGKTLKPRLYYKNMREAAKAFSIAAAIIRETHPAACVITIQNLVAWQRSKLDFCNLFLRYATDFNTYHLDRTAADADWIGFTYYMGEIASPLYFFPLVKRSGDTSDLGWPIDPAGLLRLVKELEARYRKPLIIMENGIADRDDLKRQRYLTSHLRAVEEALAQGHDVRGYFHWSLVDNFEWSFGYDPKFGLFRMNRDTRALEPKDSARLYREAIARAGR